MPPIAEGKKIHERIAWLRIYIKLEYVRRRGVGN